MIGAIDIRMSIYQVKSFFLSGHCLLPYPARKEMKKEVGKTKIDGGLRKYRKRYLFMGVTL